MSAPVSRQSEPRVCPHCDGLWDDHPDVREAYAERPRAVTPAANRTLEELYGRLIPPAVLGFAADLWDPPYAGCRIYAYLTTCHDEQGQSCASGVIHANGELRWVDYPPKGVFKAEQS